MNIYDNEFIVSRNETFVYNKSIVNKDGSPYIVSSQINSPMIRMTISDNEETTADATYILNRYLDLKSDWADEVLPRFYRTTPVQLTGTFETAVPGDMNNQIPTIDGVTIYNYAIWYTVDSVGKKTYKQYTIDGWTDYNYTLIVPFGVDITKDWVAKNYYYGIFLMGGILLIDKMRDTCVTILLRNYTYTDETSARTAVDAMNEAELYQIILNDNNSSGHVTDVAMIDDREVVIDTSDSRWSPYWTVDYDYPMLNPSLITVKNDPIGGLL